MIRHLSSNCDVSAALRTMFRIRSWLSCASTHIIGRVPIAEELDLSDTHPFKFLTTINSMKIFITSIFTHMI